MRFWDSSAVLPLLVAEADTATVQDLLRADPIGLVWWGTTTECTSALARLEREGSLTGADLHTALGRLDDQLAEWHEIQPVDSVRRTARRLLRTHPLRAADALQLAAAIAAAEGRPDSLEFVCLDQRLREAAQREGFPVLP
ncbi:MAG: type II toxin-antitoxin system VapC family toxin [Sporichthyaceae bacterium]